MKKLFLIDGHSLIFRMYYAFLRRPMVNSKGEDTSILFGFTKYLLELINKEHPSHIAVAFDPPAKTFRHEIYPEYKANRNATPELVKAALNPLVDIVESLGIPVLMEPGYEADDVIGTLAKKGEKSGFQVYMVTPDKDLGQMISDNIFQFKPGKSGAENEVIDKEKICAYYGIDNPSQIADILTIWGDASDNVKGVKGIGEVGAKKLVSKYKTVENIIKNLMELPEKQRIAFEEALPYLQLSKTLVTIKADIDINVDENSLVIDMCCNDRVSELFNKYEFNSLKGLLPSGNITPKENFHNCVKIQQVSKNEIYDCANSALRVSIKVENGIIISCKDKYAIFEYGDPLAKKILENSDIVKVGYETKSAINTLRKNNICLNGKLMDIEIMHYLLNPERTHKLEFLTNGYLNLNLDIISDDNNKKENILQGDLFSSQSIIEQKEDKERSARECVVLDSLFTQISNDLKEQNLSDLYLKIEMPLIPVLAQMEYEGITIDPNQLLEYSKILTHELSQIEAKARTMADEPTLNLSSPRQIGIVLYEKMNLNPRAKKNQKENYHTDEETLMELIDKHPIINAILEFRATKKLLSTYIDPLPALINPDTGKIHTTFNQALTSTGRLSSVRPNLQNIPIRTEKGREIRKAFVPCNPDGFIVSADYSQIELRLIAELSQDEGLLEDFRHGQDIHASTASKIFKISPLEVTREQRRQAKVANFGIIYGISAFGLSQRLNIPRGEAKILIDEYFKNYPKVKEYMDNAIKRGKEQGYVETLFGRKRYLPDINSKNQVVRGLSERNAINAPIQGSAADIIKMAMINVHNRIKKEKLKSVMVLQVHDELVFDVISSELDIMLKLVKEEMENVYKLSIPLIVDCSYGKNWLEAH
ncbi:MAG: DNA polymerase I [Bacteroidales bacterium]